MVKINAVAVLLLTPYLMLGLGPAEAHHSQAKFNLDPAAMETIEGTVTRFDFKNPHVYLYVEAEAPDGTTVPWELEATSTPNLIRRGWSADTVRPGDRVMLDIHPALDPALHTARLGALHFADGRMLSATSGGVPPTRARATSLAGRWYGRGSVAQMQMDRASLPWSLTAKAQAALDAYDGTQNPQSDCIPMTAPTIMLYTTVMDITLTRERLDIDGEWLSFKRTIYLDGRAHPPPSVRTLQGHSVGHWEGATLVVDTTNYADHAAGNAFEIPSGALKHTVERLTLRDDGQRVDYAFLLEDPEYMNTPIKGDGWLEYQPDLERQPLVCDREVARRFAEEPIAPPAVGF